jgi:aryl-alcohol dehydrogenase-like predicted oxidoreductase
MRYRKSADGLLEVSVVGVGTYAAAGVYGKKDPAAVESILRASYERGVNFFDTAPAYGEAQELVGNVFRDVRPDVIISTKVPACLGDVSCSYEVITSGCAESLERLKTDYIDLYQIHFDDGKTPVEEVVRAFEHLKSRGLIRAYGIGHVSPERAAEYMEKGSPSTVMGELNAISRNYYLKMLPLLEGSIPGYIGFSITGRGMLTEEPMERSDLSPGDIRQMDAAFAGERRKSALRVQEEFCEVGGDLGASTVQVAIAWAISQRGVLTGLVGPSTESHLDEDVRAAELELEPSVKARLDSFLKEETSRLKTSLTEEVAAIIATEITDVEKGASSLIYAMEGLAELDLAADEDLVSNVGSVIKIMKGGKGTLAALETIRRDLLNHVKTT